MSMEELEIIKDTFYVMSNIPFFWLNDTFDICKQSEDFPVLPMDFFHHILEGEKLYERYTLIYKKREVFALFKLSSFDTYHYAIIGPIVYNIPRNTSNLDLLYIFKYGNIQNQQEVVKKLPSLDNNFYRYLQFLHGLFYKERLTHQQFHDYLYRPRNLKYGEKVFEIMFTQREDYQHTYTYQDELLMLEAIRNGDSMNARVYATKLASGRIGKMSDDQLRKSKYAIVASIAIITRAVIEVGVSIENAYALSDVYIVKVDEEFDGKHLIYIFFDAIMDFTGLVKMSQHHNYPVWVRTCMEYMDQHLHAEITLEELGDIVHMAPSYISVQFKKIVGKSIKQYVNEQKIKEAKFLLRTSDMSIQEIALTLNYGTQSYFTKVFKDITNTSPIHYRNEKKH